MSSQTSILEGIRVIETASMVMVPSVGAIMAEYGAEVIKIEPPDGDLNRRGHLIPGMPDHDHGYCFLPDNRNKKSLCVDLKDPAGRDILYRLVEGADVFLTNYRRKALERLAISYEALKEKNPRLIYAHGTGFGDHGREADKPGFDAVCYWSRSGLEASLFPLEGWLGPTGYGTGDHPSGLALFGAVMLALFERERSGKGCRVSTSLIANGAWSNSIVVQARLCDALFHERKPREEARNFTGVYYRSGDDRLFKMTIVNIEQGWPRVCRAIGRADLIEDPDFATIEARSERMPEIVRLCDEIFARRDMAHWSRMLEEHDVPFSVISSYDDVVADEQIAANGIFVDVDDPDFGRVRTTTSPINIDGHEKVAPRSAPRLGEHSREVLRDLDLDEAGVDRLFESGVVK